ncbi:hypothetical protein [aff. Roholtiella sp. LEGE 12411]|uniref:hypothetical protein n=1 Tax=aff. Roholtiella sp. LEGE 12411 TaxID=1828822 RepID=UPI00351C7B60
MTGVTNQDGYYLSHLLLNQGYRVVGLVKTDLKRLQSGAIACITPKDAFRKAGGKAH